MFRGCPLCLTPYLHALGSRRYVKGKIEFHWLDTRTFPVTYMDSQVAYNARVVSGTMSSTGSSGGSSGSSLSGDASNTQTTAVDMKSTLYEDTKMP